MFNFRRFVAHDFNLIIFTGVLGMWNLVLHTMQFQDIWRTWLRGLRLFISVGAIFSIFSLLSMIIFLILAGVKDKGNF